MSSSLRPPLFAAAPGRARCGAVFFDVDDTLTWHGRLVESAVTALYAAKRAGFTLCAVTGRSFAWGELLVRLFPLDAVVVETGAAALVWRGTALTELWHERDAEVRQALSARRAAATARALATVPTARLAKDNVGRVCDTAFDLVEEGAPVDAADAAAIRGVLVEEGLVVAQSSVHINAFAFGPAGPFDKASMVARVLARLGDRDVDAVAFDDDAFATLCYVGDSQNDGPMFARARLSVGVNNVRPHLDALHARGQAPRYVVDGDGGHGFAEVVAALIAARG
jgi:HAD superfamily hydrolase (TIGR01484 family)